MSYLLLDQAGRTVQAFQLPPSGETTTITLQSGVSVPSGVLPAGVYRIVADVPVHIALGANATASDLYLPANQPEYFYVKAGESVSALAPVNAGPGTLFLTRMP